MEHLYFTKVDNPVRDRRKRGGFSPRTENKNNVRHGETLLSQVEHNMNENRNDIERLQFNPNLVMKVSLEEGAILSEDHISKLESMGLRVIDTEEKELMVLFADDYELKEFKNALNNYKNGVIAKTKVENEDLFSAVASISRWDIEDRKGQELGKLLSIDYIDCYLWIFDSITETKQKAEEFIQEAGQYAIKICDKYISQSVAIVRLKIEKENLNYYLKNPLVYRIDKKPNYNIKKSERKYLQYSLGELQYNTDNLHDDSPAICVIDSGILSGHPLLKDTIADAKIFYVTEGYSPNENDIAGHGTMVAGICEYGKINLDTTFVPRINLYSAKIHDGEYIGDYSLCAYELQEEGINLSFEQDEHLYSYFQGDLTEGELFNLLNLKGRINETKSIVRKHTNAQEKLIPNQMREIVEYFYNNYGCRIFNLSQGDLNYPYDDKKPRAWTCVLDELQNEYDVLFIVSAGNYYYNKEHEEKNIKKDYPYYFIEDSKTRIIDPAASSLSITVGGIANSSVPLSFREETLDFLSISLQNQISSGTRIGPGIQKSVKPDFIAWSGDYVFNVQTEHLNDKNIGTSIFSLSNNLTEGLFCSDIGTSYATPFVSHIAALILEKYPNASNNLLRAILAISSTIPNEIEEQADKIVNNIGYIEKALPLFVHNAGGHKAFNKNKILHYFAGYGMPNLNKAVESLEHRVVLLADMRGTDAIDVDKTHIFELPIPNEFEKAKGKKKMIISLAFNPDVRKTRMDYLGKTMSFELIRGKSLDEVYQVYASQAGLPKEDKKEKFKDRFVCKMNNCGKEMREHGTLQRGIFEFSHSSYGDNYYLVVDCKKNWSVKRQDYAVVVTYETEDTNVQLYEVLKNRIRVPRSRERT